MKKDNLPLGDHSPIIKKKLKNLVTKMKIIFIYKIE